MKKLKILTICLILGGLYISNNVNAQWYNSYGVTNINELTESQLDIAMIKAEKTIKTGKTMTILGGLVTVIGCVMYLNNLGNIITDRFENLSSNVNKSFTGAYIMYGGGIVFSIGVPVWISGGSRKSDIEIARAKYTSNLRVNPYLNTSSYDKSIGLRFTFSF